MPVALRTFIDADLPLCTDNPGISLAQEHLTAARTTHDGLTLWETLALMRQAFVHAFLPSTEREQLLKKVDARVFSLMAAGVSMPHTPGSQDVPGIAR